MCIFLNLGVSRSQQSSPGDLFTENAIFGRVGRAAFEEVVLLLMLTKCRPILILQYGLEACRMRKTDLNSLDVDVGLNRFFMKLFQTGNLARSAKLPTGLYILPSVIFLTADKLSQDPLNRFSRSLH